ncbi:MAG: TerC family protein [Proteobacteria bacterium]|nr:TerC family protein [Pseudomonadota bacterium]
MDFLLDPHIWSAFLTLTVLEIVLGIDNIIFISILTSRLPAHQQARGRYIGLGLAMFMRIGLLLSIAWIMRLDVVLISMFGQQITARELILLGGGAFLMTKAVREIHNSLEGSQGNGQTIRTLGFYAVLAQIVVVDLVFSLDSVITAVGLVDEVPVMVAAIVTAVLVMMLASGPVSAFVEEHPTIKMLALSFLILIGVTLLGEGLEIHTPKGYIYFAMAFSFGVEMLNIRVKRRRAAPVRLRKTQLTDLMS